MPKRIRDGFPWLRWDGRYPKLVLHEKHESKVKWSIRAFTGVGVATSLVSLPSQRSVSTHLAQANARRFLPPRAGEGLRMGAKKDRGAVAQFWRRGAALLRSVKIDASGQYAVASCYLLRRACQWPEATETPVDLCYRIDRADISHRSIRPWIRLPLLPVI